VKDLKIKAGEWLKLSTIEKTLLLRNKTKKQQAKAGTKAYCISLFYAQLELYNLHDLECNFHALLI
jgi:hypothetical protein